MSEIKDKVVSLEILKVAYDELKEETGQLSEEIANLKGLEPNEDDIPKVFIDGVIPTTKDDVLATMRYVSKTLNFFAYLEIKCQGDSSLSYPKKNFTIKMFSDEARETKLKKEFKKWGEHNKFVLKANYIDHSHARNIVSSKIWSQIVASRSDYASLPEGLRNSPNNGAIEGFPVKVYNNGTYQGIYTWNIPKDDWLYGIDEDNANQFVLYGQHNTNGTYAETANNFRALWDGVSQSDGQWEVEVGTNSDIVKTALNNVISLCINADDETFKSTLNNYLDVQSTLDYYIFCYSLCSLDSLAQNMILVSYDGTKLYCSAYDLDAILGLWWNGTKFVSTSYKCPEDYQEPYSLLWERIEKLYTEELKARFFELRNSVLSLSNMVTHFERFMDVIGLDLYAEDLTVYTEIPSGSTNNIKQIRNYIRDRLAYCDAEFEAMVEPSPCTSITLDQTTLTFDEATTQTLVATVEPSDTTDTVIWESDDTNVATVSNGVVTPIAKGTCTITATCGEFSASCDVTVEIEKIVTYTITRNLTNCTSDNPTTSVNEGNSYSETLTPQTGYTLDGATVSITMNGTDVTNDVYADGVINIENVTGDVVVTVNAVVLSTDPIYPFANGHINVIGADITITNGNHVKIKIEMDGSSPASNYYIRLDDFSTNTNINNNTHLDQLTDVRFSLKTGDIVRAVKKNTVVTATDESIGTRKLSIFTTNSIGDLYNGEYKSDAEKIITVNADTDVKAIGMWMWMREEQTVYELEFDFELYVNDVRYI